MVDYEREALLSIVTLNRPERRNALNGQLVLDLREALIQAETDRDTRVIVLRGSETAFCAGADLDELRELQQAGAMENQADSDRLAALFQTLYRCSKLVVAEVNGAALGGGCGLVAACDLAYAAETARLGFPEVRIGFVPAIVSVFLVRRVGEARARELLLKGSILSAQEALGIGLLNGVSPADVLHETVLRVAGEIAGETSPTAIAVTKELLRRIEGGNVEDALAIGARMNAEARQTQDFLDGLNAFLSRTPPPWKKGGRTGSSI